MSRTTRCKNVNWFWYHKRVQTLPNGQVVELPWSGGEYTVLSKRDIYHNWKYSHGESRTRNQRSPSRYYRLRREQEYRSICKEEILRWLKDEEHEIQIHQKPQDCWWDWS